VSITGPALFRSIVKWCPTFVIDEADTALVNNDDLKEVINSGWTRGQGAVRCDAETQEPRWFSTFAPKAIGMKGRRLPDTTLSRAIIVEMKRKGPGEAAQDFRHIDDAGLARLRRQLHRWSIDNEAALADALPEMLPGFRNRVAANWNLLLAIAESAGVPLRPGKPPRPSSGFVRVSMRPSGWSWSGTSAQRLRRRATPPASPRSISLPD
jgi:putative DNA primase/helicase